MMVERRQCRTPAWIRFGIFALALGAWITVPRQALAQSATAPATEPASAPRVESPDGNVVVEFALQNSETPAYRIQYKGKVVVGESRLGFAPDFTAGFQLIGVATSAHSSQWNNELGERRNVPDNYHELDVDLKQSATGKLLSISFRAYDEGAAFRYTFPDQATKQFNFSEEQTEFRFPEDTYGYEEHATEGDYKRAKIADMLPQVERPLTLEYASGIFAALAEADCQRYPRMLLSSLPGVPGALVSHLGGTTSNTVPRGGLGNGVRSAQDVGNVTLAAGESTPWRVFVVGEKPGDLLERNYLLLNLNPPSAIRDASWIKPGKVMRSTVLSTANAKAIIDFAPQGGFQYVLFDDGWYGGEDAQTGDATTVRKPALDIPEVVQYGKAHGIGVLLYVDRRQAEKQRDALLPLYEQWGIKGLKIGFVDVGPQAATTWITDTLQAAADHHLMINIHDGYRPTGNQRTWPNLMSVEGIEGNEHMPTPEHNCTLPFTRFIAGEADYTICYYDGRKKGTYAHQLAMAAVYFSPLTWVFWYDLPTAYHGEPELEFWRHCPTVWDETRVINGKIGQYVTIARRSGEEWFVGTLNNSLPRNLQIPLSFLARDKKYTAHIYTDDPALTTRTKVAMTTRAVDAGTTLDVPLVAGGGHSIWIEPAK